jgi:hypothetical protein
MRVFLGIGALIALFLVFCGLPETIHPGVSGYEKEGGKPGDKRRFVLLNPLKPLELLISPVLLATVSIPVIPVLHC